MSIASALAALLLPALLLPAEIEQELGARRLEAGLLNRAVEVRGLRARSPRAGRWSDRALTPARVTVLHLWAVDCAPCIAELPVLRDIARGYRETEPAVAFHVITETLEEERLTQFLAAHAALLPPGDVLQTDGRMRQSLQVTQQPITLVVDRGFVIRQAFVGSIAARRAEFVSAIEHLLGTTR